MGMSYSAVSTAYTCYRKYDLLFNRGEKAPAPLSADMSFGTAMHAGLQAILEKADGLAVFDAYWESEKEKELAYGRFNWENLMDTGLVLLTRFERLHAKHFDGLHQMEERLYGKLGGHNVEGTPDYLGSFQGIPSVVDFKTSGAPYVQEQLDVNEQMYLYAELARQSGYHPKQLVYYVFVKSQQRIQILRKDLTEAGLSEKLKNIEEMCDDLTTRSTFPMNRNSCLKGSYQCSFYGRCYLQAKPVTEVAPLTLDASPSTTGTT